MLSSLYLFILQLNNKRTEDGNYVLVVVELIATVLIVIIIRNT